jgi:hypothetical protein
MKNVEKILFEAIKYNGTELVYDENYSQDFIKAIINHFFSYKSLTDRKCYIKHFDKFFTKRLSERKYWNEKLSSKISYKSSPKRIRKDNQNPLTETINYGSGCNGSKSSIRVPSRKHKNRFKNFTKLFPNYCEWNNIKL